jgi:3D (Asp-Asp-Asp) domain-containing protein
MSLSGSLHHGAQNQRPTVWWGHIRNVLICSLLFTLGITLSLFAQDTQLIQTVTVRVDGSQRQVHTTQVTVQALLRQLDIHLSPEDRSDPSLTAAIKDGMTVTITRISHATVTREIEQPSPVVTRLDPSLIGVPCVVRRGRSGLVEETTVIWKKNGVVAIRWVESTRVVRAPTPTVILRGVSPSRGGARRVLNVVATAYDPSPASCGRRSTGHTAMGLKAGRGVIAVDPHVIPLGSRVFVEGYGFAIAADTGGAIKGNRIDVCFDNRWEALHWGRHTVKILIY